MRPPGSNGKLNHYGRFPALLLAGLVAACAPKMSVGTLAGDGPPARGPDSAGRADGRPDGAPSADAAPSLPPDAPPQTSPDAARADAAPDGAVADPRACGNVSCADGWCELPPMECGAGRSQGRCLPHENNGVCLAVYEPVCGCDGTTYGNDCSRLQGEMSLAYVGECKPLDAGTRSDGNRP
jgi:Kazal-type serine protease inhibitor-like protein